MAHLSVALAGSTERTTLFAQRLHAHPNFTVPWVLTPIPKPVGRSQTIIPNPLHQWARTHNLPVVFVERTITETVRTELEQLPRPDLLLVVDFGYVVPNWLLSLPSLAPVNIHPSALPHWRGSSPGQCVLLSGESTSAVSVIVMNSYLDQGPIIAQLPFVVDEHWTTHEYYHHSFSLCAQQLPDILSTFAAQPTRYTPQPISSPTPIARRITKEDTFVEWHTLAAALDHSRSGAAPTTLTLPQEISHHPLLSTVLTTYDEQLHAVIIERAIRAFTPWPLVWTFAPTTQGTKRVQLIASKLDTQTNKLILEQVKIEGLSTKPWHEVKNYFSA